MRSVTLREEQGRGVGKNRVLRLNLGLWDPALIAGWTKTAQ